MRLKRASYRPLGITDDNKADLGVREHFRDVHEPRIDADRHQSRMCYGIYAANKFRIHVLLPSVLVQGMRQAAIAPQVLVELANGCRKRSPIWPQSRMSACVSARGFSTGSASVCSSSAA